MPSFHQQAAVAPGAGFVSPRRRRLQASTGLVLALVLCFLQVFWLLLGLGIYAELFPDPGEAFWAFYNEAASVFSLFFLGVFLLTGVFFVRWQRLLVRNLSALGHSPQIGQTIAALGWLIPWVNLFLPYRSLAEIARISRPDEGKSSPALVGIWWASWLLSSILGGALVMTLVLFDEQTQWPILAVFELVSTGCTVLCGLLALWVLQLLTQQQLDHHATLQQAAVATGRAVAGERQETENRLDSEDQEADHQIDPEHRHHT